MQCTNTFCSSPNHHLPQQKLSILRANQSLAEEQNRTQKRGRASVGSSPKLITSTSNPFVKHCVKLRQSPSYRHSHGSVLVVGTTPIRELNSFQQSLQERTSTMDCLLLLNGAVVPEGLDDHTLPIVRVTPLVMNKLSGVESSESTEAAAVMRIPRTFHSIVDEQKDYEFRRWFPSLHRILVLDGIQDPGNLGTLLRSAVAFNWGGVFLLPGCCDPFNDKALRASRGASFQLPIVSGYWTHLVSLKIEFGMRVLAGRPEGDHDVRKPVSGLSQQFADSLLDEPLCLVLGSEGRGLSEKSESECELVSIPMTGKFESLNVSVAGGIFMFVLQPRSCRNNLK
ncbi:uncharacterized protein LOC116199658 isoform X1 [Punica granatum]|uniref:Uncharacterized protein LOC116199658 isoform X1 n=1 Tax=Punica granatum TaxID=22663 RepID=A0A218W0M0_PUNGR|nr:uncharacterized protein LOC116199658 isoform X1 [Punica granatum]OWM66196.1 hypothetical protein CDL15_Pgr013413 [Punica granatum]